MWRWYDIIIAGKPLGQSLQGVRIYNEACATEFAVGNENDQLKSGCFS